MDSDHREAIASLASPLASPLCRGLAVDGEHTVSDHDNNRQAV